MLVRTCFISYFYMLAVFTSNAYTTSSYDDNLPKSEFCKWNTSMSMSCYKQIAKENISEDACEVIRHYRNSSVCSDENFYGDYDEDVEASKVSIYTYLYRRHNNLLRIPALNVSFSNIKWKRVIMRFYPNNASDGISFCREFRVDPNVRKYLNTLFHDCLWNDSYDSQAYLFEYLAEMDDGQRLLYKYVFFVPNPAQIDDIDTPIHLWQTFSTVDVSFFTSKLTLHVQPIPENINASLYRIELLRKLKDNTWVVGSIEKPGNMTEIIYQYDTSSKPGIYHFTVTLISEECENRLCYLSKTPAIVIGNCQLSKKALAYNNSYRINFIKLDVLSTLVIV